MQLAYLVISESRKLVEASEVNYSDYGRVFQCPHCNETLHFRKGHERRTSQIHPTFVHPEGDEEDCPARAIKTDSKESDVFEAMQRGQNSKKIEKAVLTCFQNYLRGWQGAAIDFDGSHRVKIPNYEYVHRFRLISTQYNLPKKFIKKFVEFNSTPGRVYNQPELLLVVMVRVIRDKKSDLLVERLLSSFLKLLLKKEAYPTVIAHKAKLNSVDERAFIQQHYEHLIGIIKYLRFGSTESLTKDVLATLLWCDYKHLPISPTKIETKTERTKRMSYMKHHIHKNPCSSSLTALAKIAGIPRPYITLSSERVFDKVLDKKFDEYRASYIDQLQQFEIEMLRELYNNSDALDKAYSDLYKQVMSPAAQLISFAIKKIVEPCQFVNWSRLPYVYETGFSPYNSHDLEHYWKVVDSECPALPIFSLIDE